MTYNGVILKSRTLDLVAVSGLVDVMALGFLAYSPEQLHISVPIYAGIRIAFGVLQWYLRLKTSGPVGQK